MMSVLIKMADVNVRYFKENMDLLKFWHPKVCIKRIQHAFVDRIDNSLPRVTNWHLVMPSSEPRERIVYLKNKLMIDSFTLTIANSGEITIKGARKSDANVITSISDCFTHISNLSVSSSHSVFASVWAKAGTNPSTIMLNLKGNSKTSYDQKKPGEKKIRHYSTTP